MVETGILGPDERAELVRGLVREMSPKSGSHVIAVCSNPDATAYPSKRTRAVLVVEVSDTSLEYDLGPKASLYAEAGVPEYWVVNLVERVLVVLRKPEKGSCQVRTELDTSSRITPGTWSDLTFEISDFLPPSTLSPPDDPA